MKGKFLVFEGCHASGKTTLARRLSDSLGDKGKKVLLTKEPFNENIRAIIEKISEEEAKLQGNLAVLYLLSADRYLHLDFIGEQLEENDFVISDRYILSSLVYQQMQGISASVIEEANSFCIVPDLTFFVDAPLDVRLRRSKNEDRKKPDTYFRKKYELERDLYNQICKDFSDRYKIIRINNDQPLDTVVTDLEKSLLENSCNWFCSLFLII
ncbi:MAG: dTMP kinase [Nanoarchaeota archaeon]